MKIQPLKSYKPPVYPTMQEARRDARLLERLPKRWKKNSSLAPLIGTGLAFHLAGSGCKLFAEEKDGVEVRVLAVENEAQAAAKNISAFPVTRVAPILEEALANDGRGSFGCVAVSSPIFLPEHEAVELIRSELERAGLVLRTNVVLEGLNVPGPKSCTEEEYYEAYQKKEDWVNRNSAFW